MQSRHNLRALNFADLRENMSNVTVKLAVTNYLLCKLERMDSPNIFASVFEAIYLDSTPFTDLNSFMFDFNTSTNTLIVLEIVICIIRCKYSSCQYHFETPFNSSFYFVSNLNNLPSFTLCVEE